jgi:DNA-binding response OmpR family regulator/anti-sigma regulatory factor (Ser/Thr protein kinase)
MASSARVLNSELLPGDKEKINVLVVDDNEDFAELLATGLSKVDNRMKIHTVSDADTALTIIETSVVDCVIADYSMPDLTGIQLLRVVRETHPTLPYILYTGKGDEKIASKAITLGATDYLTKSTGGEHYEHIATMVRAAVRKHHVERLEKRRKQITQLTEARGNTGGFEIDTNNGLVVITDGAHNILDTDKKETISKQNFLLLFSTKTKETIQHGIQHAIQRQECTTKQVQYKTRGNESNRTLKITFLPTQTPKERLVIQGVMKDITDQVKRENQMEVFDRVLRHNIRNDLNLIRGNAEMIDSLGSDKVSEYTEQVIVESDQLLEAVSKQRDIMEILRNTPSFEEMNVKQTFARIQNEVNENHSNATITIECSDSITTRTSERLPEAIEELTRNAVIHSEKETPEITLTCTQTQQETHIEVTDTNSQIPEMEREVLIKPHERSPLYHGSGLGLWLVKLIVKEAGGNITISENTPTGNNITINIPR